MVTTGAGILDVAATAVTVNVELIRTVGVGIDAVAFTHVARISVPV